MKNLRGNGKNVNVDKSLIIAMILLVVFISAIYFEKLESISISKKSISEKLDETGEVNNMFFLKINKIDKDFIVYSYLDKNSFIRISMLRTAIVATMVFIIMKICKKFKKTFRKKPYKEISEFIRYNEIISEGEKYIRNNQDERCIAIAFDIDKFKIINDVYGYRAGDEVLNSIARNIGNYFKDNAIYGRITGDIFIIITTIKSREYLKDALNIVKNKITDINNKDFNISVDVSIGVYEIEKGESDVEKIISNADMARIKSKEINNISYVLFDEKLKVEKKKILELERDLFNAIDNNEFKLYYQPKFNIHTGNVVGAEALIRWEHDRLGMISPTTFIPLAEKSRFINKIGRWVLEDVCKTIRTQQDNGLKVVPIAINLSRVELYQKDLVSSIDSILKKYDIDPSLIEIEVTESTALKDLKYINKKLNDIKALGIKIAMDDFGTGNSNLSGLKDIAIDVLKLDKSLLNDIEKDIKTQVMVKSILNLSKDLALVTVCEGVENANQVNVLKSINADVVQGYVYSKPLKVEDFNKMLSCKIVCISK